MLKSPIRIQTENQRDLHVLQAKIEVEMARLKRENADELSPALYDLVAQKNVVYLKLLEEQLLHHLQDQEIIDATESVQKSPKFVRFFDEPSASAPVIKSTLSPRTHASPKTVSVTVDRQYIPSPMIPIQPPSPGILNSGHIESKLGKHAEESASSAASTSYSFTDVFEGMA